jgi:plasmid maintenance system antidote protein VapI
MAQKKRPAATVGEVLRELLTERGLSVYALAMRSGVSNPTLHALLHDSRAARLETVRRLAAALGVSVQLICDRLPPVELGEESRPRRGRPPKGK